MNPAVNRLNIVLCDVIERQCRNKKVLLTLSGGMDSRVLLSVLEKLKIPYDTFTYENVRNDIRFVKKLQKRCSSLKHPYFIYEDRSRTWYDDNDVKEIFDRYDVVLNTEHCVLDYYEYVLLSEQQLQDKNYHYVEKSFEIQKKHNSMFYPILQKDTLKALSEVPIWLRRYRFLQRCLIMLNCPVLMQVGYTCYNLRLRVIRIVFWYLNDILNTLGLNIFKK